MPSRRIINKRSKPYSKRYLKLLGRTATPQGRPATGSTRYIRWSQDFVVCDGDRPLQDILESLGAPEPEFVILKKPRPHQAPAFLALRPIELRRARTVLLARSVSGGDRKHDPHGASHLRRRLLLQRSAVDAVERYREFSGPGTPGAWTRRIVRVDPAGWPCKVGDRTMPSLLRMRRMIEGLEVVGDLPVARIRESPGPGVVDFDRGTDGNEDARRSGAPSRTPSASANEPPPSTPGGPTSDLHDRSGDPEHESIVRHPSISAREAARPGHLLLLDLNLLRLPTDPDTESTGFRIEGLPDDWESLPIHVQVAGEHLEFDDRRDRGTILVLRNQDSIPCVVAGRVSSDCADDHIEVLASFSYRGRACSLAQTRVPVAGRAQEVKASTAPEPAPVCEIWPAAEGALLTVYIKPLSDSTGRKLLWILTPRDTDVPGLPAKLDGVVDLGVQPRTFVKRLLDQADSRRKGMHASMLESLGQMLYDYAPECFHKAYWALRRANPETAGFPIQFICGEPHIPWEMMYPYDPDAGESAGFLFAEHPVARWLGDYSGWLTPRFRKGRVLSITPNYARAKRPRFTRMKPLPWAQAEGRFLRQKVGAVSIRPTWNEVMKLLRHGSAETVSVLHFAGHGSYDWHQPERSRIFLEDEELKAMEIRNANFVLGRTHRPLVIFNACETGASGKVLDKVAGWANSFLHTRFGGFIAPLWSVYDDDAAEVVALLVTRLMTEGLPVSVVLQQLRRDYAEASPTFLAYLYYGDVMARVA